MPRSPRTPLTLAALATVAIPGLNVVATRPSPHPAYDVDVATVLDGDGRRWVVRAPVDATAGAALEAEVELLRTLAPLADSQELTFTVPHPAGFAPLSEGGRAMVHPELSGSPLDPDSIDEVLASRLGGVLAQIHDLDPALIADAGLPVYDAASYRTRRLAELDEAARTGHVPPALLRRWERALEDVRLWRFVAVCTHGDLAAEHVLVQDRDVTAVLNWGQARVADPADDLAWLLAAAPEEAGERILGAYRAARSGRADDYLATRALLSGELALARWLMHGVRAGDDTVIDDAIQMLRDLDEAVQGSEPIGATPDVVVGPEDDGQDGDEGEEGDEGDEYDRGEVTGEIDAAGHADPAPAVAPGRNRRPLAGSSSRGADALDTTEMATRGERDTDEQDDEQDDDGLNEDRDDSDPRRPAYGHRGEGDDSPTAQLPTGS